VARIEADIADVHLRQKNNAKLLERDPENAALLERHDELNAEMAALQYDLKKAQRPGVVLPNFIRKMIATYEQSKAATGDELERLRAN
jgi:predicted nuclease with TOPRIM domain